MLAQRLRRRASIEPALVQGIVFLSGLALMSTRLACDSCGLSRDKDGQYADEKQLPVPSQNFILNR